MPDSKMKVLEAMSLLYEMCLKKDQYNIDSDSDLYKQILKSYNDLQILRDDSAFVSVEVNLNDQFIRAQKVARIKELMSPPFNATKDSWMK